MRKAILILLFTMLWFSQTSSPIRADGMIIPTEFNTDYLVVRRHRVTVDIRDNHAVTRVEQEFYNPHSFPVSGRYLFPVPPEAMLSHFQATVDGISRPVTRQEPAVTNALLFDAVAQRRDPTLLQYADWETLALDIDLPAGGSRQMGLEYEEVLKPSGGLYRYRYVLSTERYSSEPLEEVSLTVNLNLSTGLASLYSPTHSVTTHRAGAGQARVSWQAENVRPTEDFELLFTPAESGFGGGLLTGQQADQNHFLFLFSPEPNPINHHTIPKDVVFVIDRSGSMMGEKIDQAQNALHFILGQLNEADRFSIVGFDHRLLTFAGSLRPVDRPTLAEARHFVSGLSADGNTDLEAALQTGLQILAKSESRQAASLIIFLTDGLPTAGVTDESLIARLVAQANTEQEARLHVFGVGYDVNTHLLDRLAAENGGTVTYVQPGENLETVLTKFYGRIADPVLTDLSVQFEGLEVSELYPQQIPDMFQGSSLLLTGRYRAATSSVTVRVQGQVAGETEEYLYHFDLDQIEDRAFVPRLWATRRIGELLDRVRVEGETPELIQEIRSLGLGYGLVTPYTTFIIEAQSDGVASAANMELYADKSKLNQVSGQTTIQARVQNQAYQQADQVKVAQGANVINYGQHSLAQVTDLNIDLSLLQPRQNLQAPITAKWLEQNIEVDRQITFGSEEYFALAGDPSVRPLLQSGPNVIFLHRGEVIKVQERSSNPQAPQQTQPDDTGRSSPLGFLSRLGRLMQSLVD